MNIETARAVLKSATAPQSARLEASDYLIRNGDATDKAFGFVARDCEIAPTMRVLHYMAPRKRAPFEPMLNKIRHRPIDARRAVGFLMAAALVCGVI